jgi:hypothetical protein
MREEGIPMIDTLDAERRIEEFLSDTHRRLTEREVSPLDMGTREPLPYLEMVPGKWHPVAWEQVRLQLEQAPNGAWYRGHLVAWVSGSRPGVWLHEVDEDEDHRFETLTQALVFIDVIET